MVRIPLRKPGRDEVDPAIRSYPFLQHVTEICASCRVALVRGSRRRRFQAEETVVFQGAVDAGLLILTQGSAKEVVQGRAPGVHAVIRILTEGHLYGLAAAVVGGEATTALVTTAPAQFLLIEQNSFKGFLLHHPAMYAQVVQELAHEMQEAHRWLASIL